MARIIVAGGAAVAGLGGLDGVVNVAGGFVWETLQDGSLDTWDRMYRMNLRTAVTSCRAALAHLGQGRAIVNVGAAAAARAEAGMRTYAASNRGCRAHPVAGGGNGGSRHKGERRSAHDSRYPNQPQGHARCRFLDRCKPGGSGGCHRLPAFSRSAQHLRCWTATVEGRLTGRRLARPQHATDRNWAITRDIRRAAKVSQKT